MDAQNADDRNDLVAAAVDEADLAELALGTTIVAHRDHFDAMEVSRLRLIVVHFKDAMDRATCGQAIFPETSRTNLQQT